MRGGRFLWFLISLALGIVLGLAAGRAAAPLRAAGGSLKTLQPQAQAEAVLMVAEIYAGDGNAASAAQKLSALSDQPALRLVQQAIISGGEYGYSKADLDAMLRLAQGLQSLPSGGNTP